MDRIRIVESVPDVTFGKAFCFQVLIVRDSNCRLFMHRLLPE